MSTPKITIGMATYEDFEGVWATVQSVFLHNDWESPDDVEIVIVDTSPVGSDSKKLVEDFVAKGGHLARGARTPLLKYVSVPNHVGTTEPRNMVFEIATAPFVVVMDCHVMLRSNALLKLSLWAEKHKDCKDLIHGPIIYDNLHTINTQFSDQFRGGMWGTWSTVWKAPDGTLFVTETEEVTDMNKERKSDGLVHYHDPFTLAPLELSLPRDIPWPRHEQKLLELGCEEIGRPETEDPFEIPGMGMGLFASFKDSWLGFAKNCSGFGGEEMNIHHKYRDAGRTTICLPFLKWNHRFGRTGGAPYPIPLAAKLRNYVLWAQGLKDRAKILRRIHTHFVVTGNFSQKEWVKLTKDPLNYKVNLGKPNRSKPLDTLFQEVANTQRDLNDHADYLRKLSGGVKTITAFVKRVEWETILVAGYPKRLDVYQTEIGELTQRTHQAVESQRAKDSRMIEDYSTHHGEVDPLQVEVIEPSDMLVLDQLMNGEYVTKVLKKHGQSAKKYIVLRGSQTFGEKAEGDPASPGLYYAIKQWIEENPEWFVMEHRPNQYGLTVLCNDPLLKPKTPIRPWPKGYGPGTQLKLMLASVGINPSPTCNCNARMKQMDEWGIEGCEANFDVIIGWLEEKAEEWGWTKAALTKAPEEGQLSTSQKIAIGWKSLFTGIAFKVDWTNPYPGLVREAIKREKKRVEK